jgi:hypothetical protein
MISFWFAEWGAWYVEEQVCLLFGLWHGFIIGGGVLRFVETVYQHLLLVLASLLLLLHMVSYNKYIDDSK